MTFQVSSSTAMQMSGTKSYHRLCGNLSLRALLRGRASRQEHSFITTSPYWPQLLHYLATLETSKPIPRHCLFTDTQELTRALRSCHPSKHGVAGRVPRSRGVAGCDSHGASRQLTMDNCHMKTTQYHHFLFPGQTQLQIQNKHQFLRLGRGRRHRLRVAL